MNFLRGVATIHLSSVQQARHKKPLTIDITIQSISFIDGKQWFGPSMVHYLEFVATILSSANITLSSVSAPVVIHPQCNSKATTRQSG